MEEQLQVGLFIKVIKKKNRAHDGP
jgi:hypothetical protein